MFSSISDHSTGEQHLFEGVPIRTDEATSHRGMEIPGATFCKITRNLDRPRFNHFSGDASGMHFVIRDERRQRDDHIRLRLGTLSSGDAPELKVRYLLSPRNIAANEGWVRGQSNKPRPFFSPDARMVFFHSDVDGQSQVFMATGYEFPESP